MSDEELEQNLAPTATNSERVQALLAIGLAPSAVATAARSSVASVRNWSTGAATPRPDADIVLDDLRSTAKTLLDGGLEPERIARWLMSRDPNRFGGMRPIERIPIDPIEVLAEAHGVALASTRNNGVTPIPLHPSAPR